jgi:hypothetical protein
MPEVKLLNNEELDHVGRKIIPLRAKVKALQEKRKKAGKLNMDQKEIEVLNEIVELKTAVPRKQWNDLEKAIIGLQRGR